MLLPDSHLIYLHVPKTAGNAINLALLPHSEDKISLKAHNDGFDRFGIQGPRTPRKHATLQEYRAVLGDEFAEFKVAISVRDPVERAVSLYFSPSRWMKKSIFGWRSARPRHWSMTTFAAILERTPSIAEFLTVDGALVRPDFVLRNESLVADFSRLTDALGIAAQLSTTRRVNASCGSAKQISEARADPGVQRMVRERFAADYALLATL